MTEKTRRCSLVLSDGQRFTGTLIGAPLIASGELVFTTGMVGYSEAITDPSYFGQILIFTYPLIGNYGIPSLPKGLQIPISNGFESSAVHTSGVIVSIDSEEAFHWTSLHSLDKWLKSQNVPGITGLDTRHLVHAIRNSKQLLARIEPESAEGCRDLGHLDTKTKVGGYFDPGSTNILSAVSSKERVKLGKGKIRVGVLDCGVKWNILRQLLAHDCEIELLPWDTDMQTVDCDAWLISNGPGDPKNTGTVIESVRALLQGERPVLGICLGHQLLALAAGAQTTRMPYGHRSHNQPVYLAGTRKGFITSQNHGYVVDAKTLPDEWESWFLNVNDQTIEGIKHKTKPFRSAQFHPEAAGGPRDTGWIIDDFIKGAR